MVTDEKRRWLLRTIGHALRHSPESHFLEMDADGWVETDLLLLSLQYSRRDCGNVTPDQLRELAGEGESARFEMCGSRIRALYGHSYATVQPEVDKKQPAFLFHGTSADFLDSIRREGLKPMRRRSVLLSSNWNYASAIAHKADGTPVVLVIGAYQAAQVGIVFHAANGHVWNAEAVPPQFIVVPSPGQSGWGRRPFSDDPGANAENDCEH